MSRSTIGLAVALSLLSSAALAQSTPKPADAAAAEAREKYRAACAADIQKFCASVGTAKGAVRTCLETNAATLSDGCKAARAERAAVKAKKG